MALLDMVYRALECWIKKETVGVSQPLPHSLCGDKLFCLKETVGTQMCAGKGRVFFPSCAGEETQDLEHAGYLTSLPLSLEGSCR